MDQIWKVWVRNVNIQSVDMRNWHAAVSVNKIYSVVMWHYYLFPTSFVVAASINRVRYEVFANKTLWPEKKVEEQNRKSRSDKHVNCPTKNERYRWNKEMTQKKIVDCEMSWSLLNGVRFSPMSFVSYDH